MTYDPTLYARDDEEEFGDTGAYSESLEEDFEEEEEEEEEAGVPEPDLGEPVTPSAPPPSAPRPKSITFISSMSQASITILESRQWPGEFSS